MPQTTFSVRMDTEVKRQLDDFCARVGMNATVAFNLFARAVLRERRLPFDITTESDPFYGENSLLDLYEKLAKAEQQIERGETMTLEESRAMLLEKYGTKK